MRAIIADVNEPDGEARFGAVMRSLFGDIRQKFTNLGRPEARLISSSFGRCQLSMLQASQHQVDGEHVARQSYDSDAIKVLLQMSGQARFSQMGEVTHLADGSLLVYDPTQPYSFINETSIRLVMLQLPRGVLSSRTDTPCDVRQHYGADASGLPRVLALMLASVSTDIACIDDDSRKHIGDTLTSLVCAITKGREHVEGDDTISASILRQRILDFVQKNLFDPELSIETIAASLRCSKRYLHRTFEQEALTLERYIWDARLERCRAALLGAQAGRLSLSQVAFSCGFNSSSHFSRAFKQRYGMTPREFRHLGDAASSPFIEVQNSPA